MLRAVLIFIGVFFLSIVAVPQENIQLRVEYRDSVMRSYAPLVLHMQISGVAKIHKGRFQLKLGSGDGITSSTVVLSPGKKIYEVMFPVFRNYPNFSFVSNLPVNVQFISDDGNIDFGYYDLPKMSIRERVAVIATNMTGADIVSMETKLRLEYYAPNPRNSNLTTRLQRCQSHDFPTSPVQYCTVDIAVIHGEFFPSFSQQQLEALRQWVAMGGSLLLTISYENSYQDYQREFLDQLTANTKDTGLQKIRYGLGRVVIWNKILHKKLDFSSPEWRKIVAFLWKLTKKQGEYLAQNGKWSEEEETFDTSLEHNSYNRYQYQQNFTAIEGSRFLYKPTTPWEYGCEHRPANTPPVIAEKLLPENIQVMPVWMLFLLLMSFLILVGPIDYFVLGWLKKRVFTWILFPLLTLLFLYCSMQLAEYYLGSTRQNRTLDIIDIDGQNRVLRRNRFTVFFSHRQYQAQMTMRNGLYTLIDNDQFGDFYNRRMWRMRNTRRGIEDNMTTLLDGQIPFAYSVTQSVPQWRPVWSRQLLAAGESDFAIKVDVDKIAKLLSSMSDNSRHTRSYSWTDELFRGVTFPVDFQGSVYIFHRYQICVLRERGRGMPSVDALLEISRRQQLGYFSLASQISPTGANQFEDLSLLDPTDPRQFLLVFVDRQGDDFRVYRRLIHIEEEK